MANKEKHGFNTGLMCDAEQHFDYLKFDQLLGLAADVCLKNPLEVKAVTEEPTAEELLIRQIGVRGLSTALDLIAQPEQYYIGRSSTKKGKDLINISAPLRWPDRYNSYVNVEVQQKIEAFGDALLNEAYLSLGTDVRAKVKEFQDATTDEEQIEVLEWLDRRVKALNKMAGTKINAQDDEEYFYHPVRLSPRALGQYPHNMFDPTCLGKSLLTASFVHQTGARTLHGGVMSTLRDNDFFETGQALWSLTWREDIGLTDLTKQRLDKKRQELKDWPNNGIHAASLVQLKSGAWYAIDPNYGASHTLEESDSQKMSSAYDDIHSLGPLVKGIERRVVLGREYMITLPRAVGAIFYQAESYDFDADSIKTILQETDGDLLLGAVRDYVRDMVLSDAIKLSGDDSSITIGSVMGVLKEYEVQQSSTMSFTLLIDEAIENTIESFFLFEESPEAITKRLRHDSGYLDRKTEDIKGLPYLAAANAVLLYIERSELLPEERHFTLEVGATNYRIGAAVLSDFATYCGDDLSYAFWLSHWASVIPITERLGSTTKDSHEEFVVNNNINWLKHGLQYTGQDGIIKEFTSQQETE